MSLFSARISKCALMSGVALSASLIMATAAQAQDAPPAPPTGEATSSQPATGGLNAANIGAALAAVSPAGIDVSSGVESAPGVKDAGMIRAFFEAVRTAERSGAA